MFRYVVFLFTALLVCSCEDTNIGIMAGAASDAVTAVTLDDEDVYKIAQRAAAISDSKHRVAQRGSVYDARLQKLVARHAVQDGRAFNFKVYLTEQVNAFAMADGTVRVNSGLMDLMNDQELLFVIGHEMGHVVKTHSRRKVVVAYGSSALRKAVASQENEIGQLARSVLGDFVEQLTNAQFSQHEERQADLYGLRFLEEEGYDKSGAVSALGKLADLARQHTFLSSHPDPEERAELMLSGALEDGAKGDEEHSLLSSLFGFVKDVVLFIVGMVVGLVKWFFHVITG
ncbi:M48 family metalloprotease [Desulfopila sp. IMCC35008]|uniref:M48 family metalloprotease n=1 Tax=Desulfopila sp. IMCC35008 TaxID=2653858 RepID=UPI0013D7091B|nr:M48 family metalloprotease [Desulfopila sp. IMCC35008]